jgi:undecaprenyl pyrophosphate phosphatase UppP
MSHSVSSATPVLGALVLSEAPRYAGSAHTAAFHTAPALVGGLLVLPWFWRLVTRSRKDKPTRSVKQRHQQAWRAWEMLLVVVALFAIATVAGAGIHLIAPLTLATLSLAIAVVWTATGTAFAMLRQDHAKPLLRLRWLTVTPGCLLGLAVAFTVFGDTWATLLFGCFSAGLGALLCDLWASVSRVR